MRAEWKKHTLEFVKPMGTSRGVMQTHDVYILSLHDETTGCTGLGECSPLPGLSIDARPDFTEKLSEVCDHINSHLGSSLDFSLSSLTQTTLLNRKVKSQDLTPFVLDTDLESWPSIRFALESAHRDLETGGKQLLF